MITFQDLISRLSIFWQEQGCIIHQGYDLEVGAGTFNPATFLRCLGPEPYNAAYVEPCRRPSDGRYGKNPNRVQHYFQYQVILKPSPLEIQNLYLKSLEAIGFDLSDHDIRFVHDDWESPTLGAWGLGWEIWMDGMEVTQFTYFQSVGGFDMKPVTGELTYGLERLAMYLQNADSFFDLKWNEQFTYGDIYHLNEIEWSRYNFEYASTDMWLKHFDDFESEATQLLNNNLVIPAYDFVMKASHAFNLLNARGVISVTERTGYITRIRNLACTVAKGYICSREKLGHPLLRHEKKKKNIVHKHLIPKISTEKEDYLLEIGSEELPSAIVSIGCNNLEKAMRKLLDKEQLSYESITTYGTPQRLTVYVKGLTTKKDAQSSDRRGPPIRAAYDENGNVTKAGTGFFKSIGIADVPILGKIRSGDITSIEIRSIKNAEYLFATVKTPEIATAQILSDKLQKVIISLDFPKKMRWSDLDITYARPLHWIVSILGEHIVPFTIANIAAGRDSRGHKQLCNKIFPINRASDYVETLRNHSVMVDIKEREDSINKQLDNLGENIIAKEKLIPQVANLSEWPMITIETFDKTFLRAPDEVLISEMVEHQKYFPVANESGALINKFVITADNTPSDEIRRGNKKVLSARLSDGVFLYEQDLKTSMELFNEKLKTITFQKELSSVYDKVMRIVKNVELLHALMNIGDISKARRAALLCKADLASELVCEFPELQGVIGKRYAEAQGEDPEVAQAIDEHWMPRGENAPLPQTDTGILVSIADKVDNILSCFNVGLKPTSSSDPYALRRQALGIIKILISKKIRLPLMKVFEQCSNNNDGIITEIHDFFASRIKTVFQEYGLSYDEIDASLSGGLDDVYNMYDKVQALHRFREGNAKKFLQLYEVYKRSYGQIKNESEHTFSEKFLVAEDEKILAEQLDKAESTLNTALKDLRYDDAYASLAQLQGALAGFWDNVKVLDDDDNVRNNRLALLQRVLILFSKMIDFSKIKEKI